MIRKLDLSSAENRMDKREIIDESEDKKKIDPRLMESKKIIKAPERERERKRDIFSKSAVTWTKGLLGDDHQRANNRLLNGNLV